MRRLGPAKAVLEIAERRRTTHRGHAQIYTRPKIPIGRRGGNFVRYRTKAPRIGLDFRQWNPVDRATASAKVSPFERQVEISRPCEPKPPSESSARCIAEERLRAARIAS